MKTTSTADMKKAMERDGVSFTTAFTFTTSN